MIDNMTGLYKISKTIRFKLIPQGSTEKFFDELILDTDKKRADDFVKSKKILNKMHRFFINKVLQDFKIKELEDYYNAVKSKSERADVLKNNFIKEIGKAFSSNKDYKKIFGKDILNYIENADVTQEEIDLVKSFKGFTKYFVGYDKNRKNIYKGESITTSVANRLINENLKTFMKNMKIYNIIKEKLTAEQLKDIFDEVGI